MRNFYYILYIKCIACIDIIAQESSFKMSSCDKEFITMPPEIINVAEETSWNVLPQTSRKS